MSGVTGEYPSQVVAHTGRPDWNRGIASCPQAASAALGVVRVAGLWAGSGECRLERLLRVARGSRALWAGPRGLWLSAPFRVSIG